MNNLLLKTVQFIKFGLVGFSNTIISLLVYYILIYLGISYLIANIAGYIISSLTGYVFNKIWVFKDAKRSIANSMIRYYVVYCSSFLINVSTMYLWVDIINIQKTIAPLLTLIITIPYNFIFSKYWTFKSKEI